jgi:diguanylate cyclase (GGDEF)-like protein/PAS domain S-box-containing protein
MIDDAERWQMVQEVIQEGIWIIDAENRTTYVNDMVAAMLGYPKDRFQGAHLFEFMDADARAITEVALQHRAQGVPGAMDFCFLHRDGSDVWVSLRATQVISAAGEYSGALATLVEIGDRKRSDHLRSESDRRLHDFIDHVPALASMKDVDGEVLLVNNRAREVWAASAEATRAATPPGEDGAAAVQAVQRTYRAHDAIVIASAAAHTFEETGLLADGMHWFSAIKFPVFDSTGAVAGVGAITTDVTERREVDAALSAANRELERRAQHDSLTGLSNRAHLLEQLAVLDRRGLSSAAMLFVDLDDFKDVNDTCGHGEGDDLLRMAATRMRGCIRPGDLLARLGGDEFAVLLCRADSAVATNIAARIVECMNEPFQVAGTSARVTASVGIAVASASDTNPEELLRFADLAMYAAKAKGKGRYAMFDSAMSEVLTARVLSDGELRTAIDGNQLVLHYQPMIDLATGLMAGAEALVRWQHPRRGLLDPDEFIPAAERIGVIVPLGAWVLERACAQRREWGDSLSDDRPFVVSVNVSARQLDDPDFAATVARSLAAAGLQPGDLCLELTETAVMGNSRGAEQVVSMVKALGVGLAIDDFGTGYASLTYLRRLDATSVKIDQSFIDGLGQELEDTTIVTAVVRLAHAMGMTVTAEGVETAEQLTMLRDIGCQHAQGYLMCRPVPAEDLSRLLDKQWLDVAGDLADPIFDLMISREGRNA